jgi:hypothetical protein
MLVTSLVIHYDGSRGSVIIMKTKKCRSASGLPLILIASGNLIEERDANSLVLVKIQDAASPGYVWGGGGGGLQGF